VESVFALAANEPERMALEAVEVSVRRYRRPWYWLVVLFAAAVLATFLVAANARARVLQNDNEFAAAQKSRLLMVEQSVDQYFGDATQLVTAGALLLSQPGDDRALAHRLVLALYEARHDTNVYGLGVFYEPYAFDPAVRFLTYYDHASALPRGGGADHHERFDRTLPGNIDEVAYDSTGDAHPLDYTRLMWYRNALASPDRVTFSGPYWEFGRSFISTLRVLKRSGKVLGVVTVDTLTVSFKSLVTRQLARGDIVYFKSARDGSWLLGTAPLPRDTTPYADQSTRLRFTIAQIHLLADTTALRAKDRQNVVDSIAEGAFVWVCAGLFGLGMTRNWRSHEARLALEVEQARLENEIDVRKKVETELRKAAYADTLTGLPNRAAFLEAASAAIATTTGEPHYAVFFIDLDRFNMINDTLGHLAGDELLKMIAVRLRESLPWEASICRLGGDEFVVCAPVAPGAVGEFAGLILNCLHDPMVLGGRVCYTAASIGVVIVDTTYRGPEELLRDADIAMYAAKERGRARYVVFDTAMRSKVAAASDLENALRRAIERHEFLPYYQPIVSIESREVTSFEALVRWNRPGSGVVVAGDFIDYAESHGLIDAIDTSVFHDVCADAALLFEHYPTATIAVNISAGHLTTPGLPAAIGAELRAHGLKPERIKLEITETAIMTNAEQARATLDELRQDGIQILVDDFGAGHSSLSYLHRLPIAGLKIDRSFVSELASGEQAVAIVRSIVALAETLGLYTIAEGVETAEQLAVLQSLGVVYAQGFFFSPALPLASLLEFSVEAHPGYGA
jgi:diguanylate cyclase (GGDEF)-like protein